MRSRIADLSALLILAALYAGICTGPALAQRIVIRGSDTLHIERPEPPDPPESPAIPDVHIEIRENDEGTSRSVVIGSKRENDEGTSHSVVIGSKQDQDIVRMGENITISADQVVVGDVVAIGGSVTVHGRVRGDVVAIGGSINLRGGGVVDGDAVSIGGVVRQDPGTRLGGQNVGMRFVPAGLLSLGHGDANPLLAFLFVSMLLLFLFLIGWILTMLADSRLRGMGVYVQEHLWRSLITGLAVLVLSPAAFVLLLVTIVGIPLAMLLPVVLPIAHLIGFVVVSTLVGARVLQSRGTTRTDWVKAMAVGLAVFLGIPLLGFLGHAVGGLLGFLGTVLIVFGLAASYVSATIGLGALVLSRFGSPRQLRSADPSPPAPAAQSPSPA